MFSISANTMYSIDEKGNHSLEVSYNDSDGIDVAVYSEGENFETVLSDAINQLDEAIAEYGDDQADVEEAENLQKQIEDLLAQVAELQARNNELEKRHAEKLSRKSSLNDDLKMLINNCRKDDIAARKNKVSDFPFASKWWA